jgi:hypothetical protein
VEGPAAAMPPRLTRVNMISVGYYNAIIVSPEARHRFDFAGDSAT